MPGIKGDTDINAFAGSKKQWKPGCANMRGEAEHVSPRAVPD
jgi:hypothetical protein